jgi:hypothetical protein
MSNGATKKKKIIIIENGIAGSVEDLPGEELGDGKVTITMEHDTSVLSNEDAAAMLAADGAELEG